MFEVEDVKMPFRWERTSQSLDTFHNVSYNIVLLQLKYSERLQVQELQSKPLQTRKITTNVSLKRGNSDSELPETV